MGLDNLLVQLGINTKAYDAGLARATKTAEGFSNTLKGQLAAAFGTGAIISWVKHVVSAVEKWKDVSEQFGISTDQAQQLEEQAKRSGLSLDDVTNALSKLNQARRAAVEGDEKMIRGFAAFGVHLKDLDLARPAVDILKQMGTQARLLGIDSEKAGILIDLLGKNGKRFQQVLKDLNNEGVNLVSEEAIERIDAYKKMLDLMLQTATAISGTVLGKLAGGDFSDVGTMLKGAAKGLLPGRNKPNFGFNANVAQLLANTVGGGVADAAFPRADLVTHGALPLPASRGAAADQLKIDIEALRVIKETKALNEKQLEALRALSKTSGLGSF